MQLLALRTVLVATDLDGTSAAAIATARSLATAAGATLHVVHVAQDSSAPAMLENVGAFVQRNGIIPDARHVHVLSGDPAHAIRLLADQVRADVIVLGQHRERRGDGGGPSLGSTALAVVTESYAPCLVTNVPLRVPLERVLVGVDLSDTARGALVVGLAWASALRAPPTAAQRSSVTMLVLHVDKAASVADESRSSNAGTTLQRELERIRADAGGWANVTIDELTLQADDAAGAITDAANERGADLVVLGTRGLGLDPTGRLGSVSAKVVRNATVPVLLVPPAVWMSHAASRTS